MEHLSKRSLPEFLAHRPFSVVHIDAAWDEHRPSLEEQLRRIEAEFDQRVSFGYVDCDAGQDYARELGIRNMPSIAYYSGTELFALVIGTQQDIAANFGKMLRGESLNETNTLGQG